MIAADVMTENPRTIRSSDSLAMALDALQSMQVRHLPVVDEDDNLVGILSDRDLGSLVRLFIEGADAEDLAAPLNSRTVAELMSADVLSVSPDTSTNAIVELMLEERIGAVPVVDGDGAVVGIVSYVDILRSLLRPGNTTLPQAPTKKAAAKKAAPKKPAPKNAATPKKAAPKKPAPKNAAAPKKAATPKKAAPKKPAPKKSR
ncbi:MAG: CBS domain-containing protein [Polyangiaceae bacterium]